MKSAFVKLLGGLFILGLFIGITGCDNFVEDDPPSVAVPVFSVESGEVSSGTEVTITTTTDGAKIYYTTDGSTPTSSSTEYTGAIKITEAVAIKAIAVKNGMTDSAVVSSAYTIKGIVASPVFSLESGEVNAGDTVEITCETEGASIYYTTDGSNPTSSSTEYTGAIKITEAVAIKAIAVKNGMTDSAVVSSAYTIKGIVASPVFSLESGEVNAGDTVEITCETEGVKIYYTTDGSTPTSSSREYTSAIEITEDVIIKAIAVKDGLDDSAVIAAEFSTVKIVAAPVFSVKEGRVNSGTEIEITCTTKGAKIYYTTGDTTPSSAGTEYTAPIAITESIKINAIAIKEGLNNSEPISASYVLRPDVLYVSKDGSDESGVGSAESPFATISHAFAEALENDTIDTYEIKLLTDLTISEPLELNITSGKTVVFESVDTMKVIDGEKNAESVFVFTGAGNGIIKNVKSINTMHGVVTEKDFTGNLTIDHYTARTWREGYDRGVGGESLFLHNGNINIVYFDADADSYEYRNAIFANGNTKIEITDMTAVIPARNEDDHDEDGQNRNPEWNYTSAIALEDNAEVVINDCTFSGQHECVSLWSGSPRVIINGGKYKSTRWGTVNLNDAGIGIINGGEFNGFIHSEDNSTLNVYGGSFISNGSKFFSILVEGRSANIKNVKIQNNSYHGIYITGGDVSIENVSINDNQDCGIIITGGTATLSNVTCSNNSLVDLVVRGGNVTEIKNSTIDTIILENVDCVLTDVVSSCGISGEDSNIVINGSESRFVSSDEKECLFYVRGKSSKITVNDGYIEGYWGIDCEGDVVINGGTIKGIYKAINAGGTVTINGGSITGEVFSEVEDW